MRRVRWSLLGSLLLVVGCASPQRGAEGGPPPGGDGGHPSAPDAGRDAGTDAGSPGCPPPALLAGLGRRGLLVGGTMEDQTAARTPIDVRYRYISGGVADDPSACQASCATGCTAKGKSCASKGGCNWWGCWQAAADSPGRYARDLFDKTAAARPPQLPMFTYYELLQSSGAKEGAAEVQAVSDPDLMRRYFADWRFLLQQVGDRQALLHLEPDFWGYAMKRDPDPHATFAAVSAANPIDCPDEENTIAGLGRCLIAMARRYAPNAYVGLHASSWATGPDTELNVDPKVDVEQEARKLAAFLIECGEEGADFVVVDAADRDAGYEASLGKSEWWDATNRTLPDFHQALRWAKALGEALGKPLIWWQVPLGNMSLPDVDTQWKDNRLDYFFDHPDEIVAADGVGMLFGAGNRTQTHPETDRGHFTARVKAFVDGGRPDVCR